jgi:hypothetical protein
MNEFKLFCFQVFGIQAIISLFNFLLAWSKIKLPRWIVDILAGISWAMTGGYWLWQALII